MRTPSSQKRRLDLTPPWADRFILGITPSITARYFSSGPADSISRWTPCPPEYRHAVASGRSWLCPAFAFGRGRDADCSAPPAQTRAGAFNAHGSYLGYLASKRSVGYGWRIQTSGS